MLQMVKTCFHIFMALVICGCSQFEIKGLFVPTGDVVQTRFEQSANMNEGLKAGVVEADENYVFYAAADPHVTNTNTHLTIFNDIFRNDDMSSFALILGDCCSMRDNLSKYLDALAYYPERHEFDHRIFHTLGNHDVYFDGWKDFRDMIGPSVYWFEVSFPQGKDLYIALDTATGTLGRKQTEWFRNFLEKNRHSYRHCIIFTHTNLFYTDNSQTGSGNLPFEETWSLIDLLGRHNVSLVLQGHDHYREEITFDNVLYTIVGTISDKSEAPEFLRVEVTSEGILLDWNSIIS